MNLERLIHLLRRQDMVDALADLEGVITAANEVLTQELGDREAHGSPGWQIRSMRAQVEQLESALDTIFLEALGGRGCRENPKGTRRRNL